MEGLTEKPEGDLEGVAVVTCEFTADDKKPWEITAPKGSLLTVLESKESWCKVEVNGQIGYVPAECLKLVTPVIPTIAQPIQSGSKRSMETDLEIESEETLTGRLDNIHLGFDAQPEEKNPRRRSSRLAKKPDAVPAKKTRVDLTWKAALERGQQNNSAISDVFQAISTGGRTTRGPSDIIKTPGINKISIFPDIAVKIEKVEPPDEETENSSEIVLSPESLDKGQLEVEIRVVKEEVDLDDFPDEFRTASRSGESEMLEGEMDEFPRHELAPNGGLMTPTLIVETLPNIPHEPTSALLVSLSTTKYNPVGTPLTSPVTLSESVSAAKTPIQNSFSASLVSKPVIVTPTLDNTSNTCCVLFAEVWKVLGFMYEPVPKTDEVPTTSSIVLNLRLVCKDWRKGVDKFYENLSVAVFDPMFQSKSYGVQNRICKNRKEMEELIPTTWQAYDFSRRSKVDKFLNHFKNTHSQLGPLSVQVRNNKNPILGRFFSFSTAIRVTDLLGKYGNHIWYCSISINTGPEIAPLHILRVFHWLKLMPNLKHFTWKGNFGEQVSLESGQHFFPYMKNLKRVVLKGLPKETKRLVIQKNGHIETLSTQIFVSESAILSNLKELSLTIRSDDEFRMFATLKQHWSLLEKIQLFLRIENTNITWRRALKVLERWKNTLTQVSVLLPRTPHPQNQNMFSPDYNLKQLPYRLDLPRVKYLKINFADGFASLNRDASLDFISPLRKSLEFLHLEYYSDYEYTRQIFSSRSWMLPNNNQIPFFFGYNSNIWNVFLKLKKVNVIHYQDHPGSTAYVPFTYSREWWYFNHQTKTMMPQENGRIFEMGGCNYRENFAGDFATVQGSYDKDKECEVAANDLLKCLHRLTDLDIFFTQDNCLKPYHLKTLEEFKRRGIYTSLGVYKCSNYMSIGATNSCKLCPNEAFVDGDKALEDHFWRTHFLFAGTYKCDFGDCKEKFLSKYDVVQHRKTHGQKHGRVYYELEAIPVHHLRDDFMKEIFYLIHVDAPHGFFKSRRWPSPARKFKTNFFEQV